MELIKSIRKQEVVLLFVALALVGSAYSDRQPSNRQTGNSTSRGFKSSCGTDDQISERIGRCMDPIFEIIEGKVAEPKSDADLVKTCDRFGNTEKCVRTIAKDCLSGIQRTSTSAVASATKRFRVNECKTPALRARYTEPMICSIKKGKEMIAFYRRSTAKAQMIRDLPNAAPEEKLMKLCCLLVVMDKEIEELFNRECPKSTPLVMGIIHAMTDDARTTLCVNPKCQNALDPSIMRAKYKPPQNLIEPIMQVLFTLSSDQV